MATLQALRHSLSARFGGHEEYITGVQLQEGGGYVGVASGTDAKRRLVSTDLLDQNLAGTGSDTMPTGTSSQFFDGSWIFVPSSREQRRVVMAGYIPNVAASTVVTGTVGTALTGYLVLNRPVTNVLPPNTSFEAHRWPVRDDDRKKGLHTAINEALAQLFVQDRLSLTGLGLTANRYTLAAYPWITDPGQLVQTNWKEWLSGLDPEPLAGGGELRIDGDTPYLITGSGLATTDTFTIDVMRPRNTWIKRGNTWGESTVGLEDDTDECTGTEGIIVTVAEYLICLHMQNSDPAGPKGNWALRSARLAATVGPWMRKQYVRGTTGRVGANAAIVANVPGGLREVASGGGTNWP